MVRASADLRLEAMIFYAVLTLSVVADIWLLGKLAQVTQQRDRCLEHHPRVRR